MKKRNENLSIRVTKDFKDQLQALADRNEKCVSNIIILILSQYFDDYCQLPQRCPSCGTYLSGAKYLGRQDFLDEISLELYECPECRTTISRKVIVLK